MPIYALSNILLFPPCELAEEDGLLAVGGDLSPERLLLAYQNGIFPWYSHPDPILWWAPDPRFIMLPEGIKISKSMKQVLRRHTFTITFDQDFPAVIKACQRRKRPQQVGTWITEEMRIAYEQLHEQGWAHSVEVWNKEGKLVGGLYGIAIGNYYSGESMFALESNASKAGYITLVKHLQAWNYQLIDCQIHTPHLESLGAYEIPRHEFMYMLQKALYQKRKPSKWQLDPQLPILPVTK